MKKSYPIYFFVVIFLFLTMISCQTDETCRQSRTVGTDAGFYLDTINSKTGKHVLLKLAIDSLWVKGIGVDSVLYKKAKVNAIKLPLNQFSEESKFRMKINTIVDTITIRYKNRTEFLSLECGSIRTHTLDTVLTTGYFVDSVSITNPTVNTISVENIQLHHHK